MCQRADTLQTHHFAPGESVDEQREKRRLSDGPLCIFLARRTDTVICSLPGDCQACSFPAVYNGIGLTTPRGSGTNGYIQANRSALRSRETHLRGGPEDAWKEHSDVRHRKPDQSILEHERKRKVEISCLELEDKLEAEGIEQADIERQVSELRARLQNSRAGPRSRNEIKAYETHELAAMKERENDKMARAFGIDPSKFKEGHAFNQEAQAQRTAQGKVDREERRAGAIEARENRAKFDQVAERRKQESVSNIQQRINERGPDVHRMQGKPRYKSPDQSGSHLHESPPRIRQTSPRDPSQDDTRRSYSRSPPNTGRRRHSVSPAARRYEDSSPPRFQPRRDYERSSRRRSRSPMARRRSRSPPLGHTGRRESRSSSPPSPPCRRAASPASDMSLSDSD